MNCLAIIKKFDILPAAPCYESKMLHQLEVKESFDKLPEMEDLKYKNATISYCPLNITL